MNNTGVMSNLHLQNSSWISLPTPPQDWDTVKLKNLML